MWINWKGAVFVDLHLPFGLCSAPKIFTAFADVVAWALHATGIRYLIHYLDDFLIVCSPSSFEGQALLRIALQVLNDLQIPMALNNWRVQRRRSLSWGC